jgi:hypothetical protein
VKSLSRATLYSFKKIGENEQKSKEEKKQKLEHRK